MTSTDHGLLPFMTEFTRSELKKAVEAEHGGNATFVQAVPVHESHNGVNVWDGFVHIFDLQNNPRGAFRAYAWSYEGDDRERRFFTVLHTPQINGPRKAVATAIVMRWRARDS